MKFEIKIGGKKRPVSFGINQTAVFCEKHKISLEQIGERFGGQMTLLDFRDLLWSGLVAGAYENKQTPDFDEWDVGTWVETLKPEEITDIINKFSNSMPVSKKKRRQRG